jgi:hypothetical protein
VSLDLCFIAQPDSVLNSPRCPLSKSAGPIVWIQILANRQSQEQGWLSGVTR